MPRPPFFIVGSERSGTTMLRLMLNRHSRLAVPPESHFIVPIHAAACGGPPPGMREFLDALSSEMRFREWELPIHLVESAIGAGPKTWAELFSGPYRAYAAARGKQRWGDKTPGHAARLGTLETIFGEGIQVLHIVRDGRDVAASLREMPWARADVLDAARRWRRDVLAAQAFGRCAGPERYHEIAYERLTSDPETILRGICRFLEEPFEERMLRFFEDAGTEVPGHRQAWHRRTQQPVDSAAVGRWKRDLSRGEVALFESAARDVLAQLGYLPSGTWAGWGWVLRARRRLRRKFT